MGQALKRLTVSQWSDAVEALRHAEADWECWETDGDPAAKGLLRGIKVLRMLIDDRRPALWEQLTPKEDE